MNRRICCLTAVLISCFAAGTHTGVRECCASQSGAIKHPEPAVLAPRLSAVKLTTLRKPRTDSLAKKLLQQRGLAASIPPLKRPPETASRLLAGRGFDYLRALSTVPHKPVSEDDSPSPKLTLIAAWKAQDGLALAATRTRTHPAIGVVQYERYEAFRNLARDLPGKPTRSPLVKLRWGEQ